MRSSFFLVPSRKLEKPLDDEVQWPELAIVSMSGELYIDTVLLCFLEFLWLMIEEDKRLFGIDASHDILEFFSLSSKP